MELDRPDSQTPGVAPETTYEKPFDHQENSGIVLADAARELCLRDCALDRRALNRIYKLTRDQTG